MEEVNNQEEHSHRHSRKHKIKRWFRKYRYIIIAGSLVLVFGLVFIFYPLFDNKETYVKIDTESVAKTDYKILLSDRFDFTATVRRGNLQYQSFTQQSLESPITILKGKTKMLRVEIETSENENKGFSLFEGVDYTDYSNYGSIKYGFITNIDDPSAFIVFGFEGYDMEQAYLGKGYYIYTGEIDINSKNKIGNSGSFAFLYRPDGEQETVTIDLLAPIIWVETDYINYSYNDMLDEVYHGKYDRRFADKTIITYGNSIFGQGRIQDVIKKQTGAYDVINLGIGGATVAENRAENSEGYISYCNQNRIDRMTAGDVILIMGGENDFGQSIPLGDCNEPYNESTFMGGLASTIKKISEKFPNAIIYVCSPVPGRGTEEYIGKDMDKEVVNDLGLTIEDYANAAAEVTKQLDMNFIDVYHLSGINQSNRSKYISDVVHLTEAGKKLVGETISKSLLEE